MKDYVTCPDCGNVNAQCPIGFFIQCPNGNCKNYHRKEELIKNQSTTIPMEDDYIDLELEDEWYKDDGQKTQPYGTPAGWIHGDGFLIAEKDFDDGTD